MSTTTSNTAAFNPKDPKFQLHAQFKPDKEESWPYPAERDGWVHAHNSIRDEIRNLIAAVGATHSRRGRSVAAWEAECILKAWAVHSEHIHSHHASEDDIMTPFLETRFAYP